MLIAEFRRRTGLTRDAVRLYVKLGLLRPAVDPGNGYQRFDVADVERVGLIRTAQQLGFSLKQMVPLAREYEAGRLDVQRRLAVMRRQLEMIEAQAARIGAMRDYVRAKIAWMEAGEAGDEPAFGVPDGCRVPARLTVLPGRRRAAPKSKGPS
jgi:DNA-binding transcriptional MerR regulator